MAKGSIVLEYEDIVDIMISQDPDIEDKIMGMAQDIDDDVDGSTIQEAAEEEACDDDDDECDDDVDMINIGVDMDIVSDDVPAVTSPTSYDMEADNMIDAYYDITNGVAMDVGDMIDIIADTQ